MNLLKFELTQKRSGLLWWSLGLSGLQFFMLSFFPLMAENQQMWDLILEYYPKEMLAAFGLANAASLGSIEGYLIFSFIFAQVALAIYASLVGFSMLSVEENENIADFLLTKPISRPLIFKHKTIAAIISFIILSVVTSLSTYLGIVWFAPEVNIPPQVFTLFLSLLPLQYLFYVTALGLSQFMRSLRSPTTLAMGLAFGMYMLYALGAAIESDMLRYFNYFNVVDIAVILNNESIDLIFVIIGVSVGMLAPSISYIRYLKKDILSK
jgi:ABC-2 type transport system permease protein